MTPPNRATAEQALPPRGLFFGLLASWNEIAQEPWLPQLLTIEEKERKRRSLERRLRAARIGSFKAMADFDWAWPSRVDCEAIDDLLSLELVDEGVNAVLIGPNGVGKTMILRNMSLAVVKRTVWPRNVATDERWTQKAIWRGSSKSNSNNSARLVCRSSWSSASSNAGRKRANRPPQRPPMRGLLPSGRRCARTTTLLQGS